MVLLLFFESIIVGFYTSIIYFLLKSLKSLKSFKLFKNINNLLFSTGFIKHFLGYFLQIHTYYCNYGYSCISSSKKNKKYQISKKHIGILILESIIEGFIFLFLGNILYSITRNINITYVFIIGCLLHLISEIIGIHKYFCKYSCV